MDNLEEFIRKNRKDIDRYAPSPAAWQNIRKELQRGRAVRLRWIPAAAMIIVLFTTSVHLYLRNHDNPESKRNSVLILLKSNSQLLETELYYTNCVKTLYTEAEPLLSDYPDIERELEYDLAQIDSLCADIRNDLKDNVDNQEVIEALISNYRIKLRILEDMLKVLRQYENNPINAESHEL